MKRKLIGSVAVASACSWCSSTLQAGALPWADYTTPHIAENFTNPTPSYHEELFLPNNVPAPAAQMPFTPIGSALGHSGSSPARPSSCNPQQFSLDACIVRTLGNHEGLLQQVNYLRTKSPQVRAGAAWANLPNDVLLKTALELMRWGEGQTPYSLQDRFDLIDIPSTQRAGHAQYTGYFTPVIEVQAHASQEYRYPIYALPQGSDQHLTRAQIDAGALRGKGLEIGWTNDPINLYFSHIQGSAIAHYPDGQELFLDYAGTNNYPYASISKYLKEQGYQDSLSNERIRAWFQQHPERIAEVLHQNPRYVFFKKAERRPKTSIGSEVIPWHTVAVDDEFIPLGSVILAEIPRINHHGDIVGSDWRLLFAQDRGKAIKGPGRLDFYTGVGPQAEKATYQMTGFRKSYLVVLKPSIYANSLAGL